MEKNFSIPIIESFIFDVFIQNALLGVFQKLIASKSNDHEGFYLLETLTQEIPE